MNDRFLEALGLCKKAGKLSFGFETVKLAAQKGEALIVFSSSDLSKKTQKELEFVCENTETEHIITEYDMKTLGQSIGKMTGIIAVTDMGFAKMLKQKLRDREGI